MVCVGGGACGWWCVCVRVFVCVTQDVFYFCCSRHIIKLFFHFLGAVVRKMFVFITEKLFRRKKY